MDICSSNASYNTGMVLIFFDDTFIENKITQINAVFLVLVLRKIHKNRKNRQSRKSRKSKKGKEDTELHKNINLVK